MKKNIYHILSLLFIISLFSTYNIYAQKWVSKKVEKKNVILEEFTGVNCGHCPDGHKIANGLTASNPGKVFLVNVHAGTYATPGAGQLDLRTQDGNAIAQAMQVPYFPSAAVNREFVDQNTWIFSRNVWAQLAGLIIKDDSPVNIATRARINPATRKLTVEVELYYTSTVNAYNFITVMLTQDNILGSQAGANTYPENIKDGKYIHNHVLRKIISNNGFKGDPVEQTEAGSYVYRKYEWNLPDKIQNIPVVIEDLNVVAHITSAIGLTSGIPLRVYNVAGSKVTTSFAEENEKLILVEKFTNANSEECAKLNIEEGVIDYLQDNTKKIVTIEYHSAEPKGDPMYDFDNSFSYQRGVNYYGAKTVPAMLVDGKKVEKNNKVTLENMISMAANSSYLSIEPRFNISNGKIKVDVDVKSEVQLTNLALRVVVLEAAVFYPEPPGTSSEKEFYFVARHMLPDATGTKFGIEEKGTRKFSLEKELDLEKLDKNKIYVAVFVQDEKNKEVLQTAITRNLEFLTINVETTDNLYSVVSPKAEKTHAFSVENSSNVPVEISLRPIDAKEDWQYSMPIPQTSELTANTKKTYSFKTKYTGDKASAFQSGYEIEVIGCTTNKNFEPGIVVYPPVKKVDFVDITDKTKAVYIYGKGISSENSSSANIAAFEKVNLLRDRLAAVPFIGDELFKTKVLDDFEFVGMTVDEENKENFMHNAKPALEKMSSLVAADKKVYFSATKQNEVVANNKAQFPVETKAITDFYGNLFGVAIKNNVKTSAMTAINLFSKWPAIESFNEKSNTDVFELKKNTIKSIYELEDKSIVAVAADNPYDDTKNRCILFGFDLAAISEDAKRNEVASNIVQWLYNDDGSIEELYSGTSNLKLEINENPIVENFTVKAINQGKMDIETDMYVIDISGKKIKTIFSGKLATGDNYFTVNIENIAIGQYIIVAETASGKTFMQIVKK